MARQPLLHASGTWRCHGDGMTLCGDGIPPTHMHEGNSKHSRSSVPGLAKLTSASTHAGGPEDWLVACCCGTRDDDGERMAACDTCAAWAHTRCAGVGDTAPLPPLFLCAACHKLGPTADVGGAAVGDVATGGQLTAQATAISGT